MSLKSIPPVVVAAVVLMLAAPVVIGFIPRHYATLALILLVSVQVGMILGWWWQRRRRRANR